MKNIFMIAKNSLDKNKIITTMILLIFSLLIVCQNSAFIFNPFILVLLCISYVISFFTLIMIGTSSSVIAFIIDKRYGLELIIITLILIILYEGYNPIRSLYLSFDMLSQANSLQGDNQTSLNEHIYL